MSFGHLIFMSGIFKDFNVLNINKEKITFILNWSLTLKFTGNNFIENAMFFPDSLNH